MTLEDLEIELAQLKYAKSKILGELQRNPDGTPALDVKGQPQYKGGAQSFIIGDTTYTRAKLKEITAEIERVEAKISEFKNKMRAPKKNFLGSQYV